MSEITNPQDAELEEVVLGALPCWKAKLLHWLPTYYGRKYFTLKRTVRFMLSCRVCTMPGK